MKHSKWTLAVLVCLFIPANLAAEQPSATGRTAPSQSATGLSVDPLLTGGQTPSLSVSGRAVGSEQAVVPRLIKFNGTLRDLSGKPLSGPVDVTFSLYAEESGGAPLWFETQTVQASSLGHYAALLGAMTPAGVPMELFTSGEAHWLGVQVANLPEQARVLLVSVPYALKAGDAETLGGKPASAFVLATQPECSGEFTSQPGGVKPPLQPGCATASNGTAGALSALVQANALTNGGGATLPSLVMTANYIPVFTDALGNHGNSAMYQSGSYVGVGTLTPAFPFDVNNNVFGIGPQTSSPGMGGTMRLRDDSGTVRWLFGIPGTVGSQDFFMYNLVNGHAPIYIENAAPSYSFYFKGNGNVGIGTNNPAYRLDVAGNVNASGNVGASGIFTGNGSGLTTLNAGNLSTGTLPSARLAGTYSGAVTFNNASNVFTGNGAGLTNLTGASVSGSVPSAVLATTATAATTATTAGTANGLSCTGCVTGSQIAPGTITSGNVAGGSFATLGENSFNGSQAITGDLTLSGTVNGVTITQGATNSCTVDGVFHEVCEAANTKLGTGISKTGELARASGKSIVIPGENVIAAGVLGATIAGGGGTAGTSNYGNSVFNNWGTIGGGAINYSGDGADPTKCCQTLGGGGANFAVGTFSTVAGGGGNHANGMGASISGGYMNYADGEKAAVGGGAQNQASGRFATVAGGANNVASGEDATAAGGLRNTASGVASLAAGCLANAGHDGSFVWGGAAASNGTCSAGINSFGAGQFLALAPGGFSFYPSTSLANPVSIVAPTGDIFAPGNITVGANVGVGGSVNAGGLTVDSNTLVVDSTNNRVGVGTAAPAKALQVNGDIYLSRAGNGIILKSAGGICVRVTITEAGALSAARVTCP